MVLSIFGPISSVPVVLNLCLAICKANIQYNIYLLVKRLLKEENTFILFTSRPIIYPIFSFVYLLIY